MCQVALPSYANGATVVKQGGNNGHNGRVDTLLLLEQSQQQMGGWEHPHGGWAANIWQRMRILHALFQLLPHTRYSVYGYEKQTREEKNALPRTSACFSSGNDHQEITSYQLCVKHQIRCNVRIAFIFLIEYKSPIIFNSIETTLPNVQIYTNHKF